ncbi:MAG: hypothetical protein RL748_2239, partial [Pseudomonadota bacterium]
GLFVPIFGQELIGGQAAQQGEGSFFHVRIISNFVAISGLPEGDFCIRRWEKWRSC